MVKKTIRVPLHFPSGLYLRIKGCDSVIIFEVMTVEGVKM